MKRLAKHEAHRRDPDAFAQRLTDYLQPTLQTTAKSPPVINKHYRDTFNSVDRFDALTGRIPLQFKVMKAPIRFLYGALSTALVNAWVLHLDISKQLLHAEDEEASLRDFCRSLADELDSKM